MVWEGAKDDTSIKLDQQAVRDIRNTTDYGRAAGGRPKGLGTELTALAVDDDDKHRDSNIPREEYES